MSITRSENFIHLTYLSEHGRLINNSGVEPVQMTYICNLHFPRATFSNQHVITGNPNLCLVQSASGVDVALTLSKRCHSPHPQLQFSSYHRSSEKYDVDPNSTRGGYRTGHSLVRPTYLVKDEQGYKSRVAIHIDNLSTFDTSQYRIGHLTSISNSCEQAVSNICLQLPIYLTSLQSLRKPPYKCAKYARR